jgi:hypothetical protein
VFEIGTTKTSDRRRKLNGEGWTISMTQRPNGGSFDFKYRNGSSGVSLRSLVEAEKTQAAWSLQDEELVAENHRRIAENRRLIAENGRLNAENAGLLLRTEEMEKRLDCVVCMDRPRDVLYKKCKHMCVCETCAKTVTKCPLCSSGSTTRINVFAN